MHSNRTLRANILTAVLLLSCSVFDVALALESIDFYTGEALVTPGKSESSLVRQALQNVLLKLTGDPNIANDQRTADIYAQQDTLVISVLYRDERAPDNLFAEPDRYLLATFNVQRLQTVMRDVGLEQWSLERPETLVWLALEEPDTRVRRMRETDDSLLSYAIQTTAKRRALPVVLPIQDQTDYALVDAQKVWAGDLGDIALAAERYDADQTLMGAASMINNEWQVRWRLLSNNGLETFTTQANQLTDALTNGINRTATITAKTTRIAVTNTTNNNVNLRLRGLNSPADFLRAYSALQRFSQVNNIRIVKATEDAVEIQLELSANREWLLRSIELSDVLAIIQNNTGVSGHFNQLDLTQRMLEVTVLPD